MDRDSLLLKLRDRRERWHRVIGELGLSIADDGDMRKVVGGGWTLADHLVHIAAWERRYARVVSRAPRLEYPSGWQAFNDAVYADWKDASPSRVRSEYQGAHDELLAAIGALPPEGDPERPTLLGGRDMGELVFHYRAHASTLLEHAGLPTPPPWRGRVVE